MPINAVDVYYLRPDLAFPQSGYISVGGVILVSPNLSEVGPQIILSIHLVLCIVAVSPGQIIVPESDLQKLHRILIHLFYRERKPRLHTLLSLGHGTTSIILGVRWPSGLGVSVSSRKTHKLVYIVLVMNPGNGGPAPT